MQRNGDFNRLAWVYADQLAEQMEIFSRDLRLRWKEYFDATQRWNDEKTKEEKASNSSRQISNEPNTHDHIELRSESNNPSVTPTNRRSNGQQKSRRDFNETIEINDSNSHCPYCGNHLKISVVPFDFSCETSSPNSTETSAESGSTVFGYRYTYFPNDEK